jgi:hexosaminidase
VQFVEQVRARLLDTLVQPVVWSYGEQLSLAPGLLPHYGQLWPGGVWAGSAWRGATGSNMAATTVRHHLNNQLAWLGLLQQGAGLAGVVLTGWARYDHYATLCELLPCGLPSLRCCLAALQGGGWTFDTHKACSTSLGLSAPLLLEPYCFLTGPGPEAPPFPGALVDSLVLADTRLQAQHQALTTSSARQTWINEWQIEKGFLNPLQVKVTLRELIKLGDQLRELASQLGRELTELMYDFTADEWVNTNISPKIREIDELVASVDLALARHEQKFVLIPLSKVPMEPEEEPMATGSELRANGSEPLEEDP